MQQEGGSGWHCRSSAGGSTLAPWPRLRHATPRLCPCLSELVERQPSHHSAHHGSHAERPAESDVGGKCAVAGCVVACRSGYGTECCALHSLRPRPPASRQGMAWEGVLCEWYETVSKNWAYSEWRVCVAALRVGALGAPPCATCSPGQAPPSFCCAAGFTSNLKGDFRWNGIQVGQMSSCPGCQVGVAANTSVWLSTLVVTSAMLLRSCHAGQQPSSGCVGHLQRGPRGWPQ